MCAPFQIPVTEQTEALGKLVLIAINPLLHFSPRVETSCQQQLSHRNPWVYMSTDYSDGNMIQCSCGRTFTQLNVYTNHHQTCKKIKKNLSSALAKAKEVWDNREKRCTGDSVGECSNSSGISDVVNPPETTHTGEHPSLESLEYTHDEINQQCVSVHHSIWWTIWN